MRFKLAGLGLLLALAATTARAQEPIRIGEINGNKAFPSALGPYRLGWQLAVEEINGNGLR
jgi:branched-chain amino acid transport system substrate-binding protein